MRPAKAATTPAPMTVPLSAITITWQREPYFLGEGDPQPVTISGEQLCTLLKWVELEAPGYMVKDGQGLQYAFGQSEAIARNLAALGRLLRELTASRDACGDAGEIFETLGDVIEDWGHRLAATAAAGDVAATVTIAPPAASEAA
jgi:hypothetical protein